MGCCVMSKRVLVFGLSGSGKSSVLHILEKKGRLLHVSAGGLVMKHAGCSLSDFQNRSVQEGVFQGRKVMCKAFDELYCKETSPIIALGAHLRLRCEDGLVMSPFSVTRYLKPDAMAFVCASPDDLIRRRNEDVHRPDRLVQSVEELEAEMMLQLDELYARSLDLDVPACLIPEGSSEEQAEIFSGFLDDLEAGCAY